MKKQKRVWNLILLILAYLVIPIRGTARRKLTNPQSFVVINPTGNIGDMVCTTPVFRAIKHKYPGSRLIVLCHPKNILMLHGNPDVDRCISTNQPVWNIVKEVRKEHIDAGLVINPSTLDFAILFLGGVRSISNFVFNAAYSYITPRAYLRIAQLGITVTYTPGKYVPGQYVELTRPFGCTLTDTKKFLYHTQEAEHHVINQLRTSGIKSTQRLVAIPPSAGTKIKQWPADRFGHVANHLAKIHNAGIVIIGGPNDIEESNRMLSVLDQSVHYYNAVGQSLDELKATLSQVDLIIGNDSGPIYIAESYGARTLVLIGPTDESEHAPQDDYHKIIVAQDRGAPLLLSCVSAEENIDLDTARAQIEAISVDEVIEVADHLLRKK